MRARESCSAATRAVISGSGDALSSVRATAMWIETSPRTASTKSSHAGMHSGVTSSASQTVSTVSRPSS